MKKNISTVRGENFSGEHKTGRHIILGLLFTFLLFVGCPPPDPPGLPIVNIGADKTFLIADMEYSHGFEKDPPTNPDGSPSGAASRTITGNVLAVEAWIEADTNGETWIAYAWQQHGVEFRVGGDAGVSALATVTFKLGYESETSATGSRGASAVGRFSGAVGVYEKPAVLFEIMNVSQPGRLPVVAEIPPNNSQFTSDSDNTVVYTITAVPLAAGQVYVAIFQAKAFASVQGEGSAASGMGDPDKMTVKEIIIEW